MKVGSVILCNIKEMAIDAGRLRELFPDGLVKVISSDKSSAQKILTIASIQLNFAGALTALNTAEEGYIIIASYSLYDLLT